MGAYRFPSGSREFGPAGRPGFPWRIPLHAGQARPTDAGVAEIELTGRIGTDSPIVIYWCWQSVGDARRSSVAANGPARLVCVVNGGYLAAADRRSERAILFLCAR